ncbi:MAG TPA: SpoIIE family protein phosphatase [Planctomycetota bacterium]|nr:SpoIIE family protein phosphatase [Planctomycetota bacterium]
MRARQPSRRLESAPAGRGSSTVRAKPERAAATASGDWQTGRHARPAGLARPRGLGLRSKFMLVLSVITGCAMVLLGVVMAQTTAKFLFGEKQHAGVEVARFAGQLGVAVQDHLREEMKRLDEQIQEGGADATERAALKAKYETLLTAHLRKARDWGDDTRPSDVLAVSFDFPGDLSGVHFGESEIGNAQKEDPFTSIYIPKIGRYQLPEGIEVYESTIQYKGGPRPVYRFKIALPDTRNAKSKGSSVRVDIDRKSVNDVTANLYVIIMVAVVAGTGVVILVANWLAGNITRPLDLLLRDMHVVARGDLAHQTKARSTDEIGVLAHEFNKMTRNLQVAQSALVEQEKAAYELSLAREVQRQLLPAEAPEIAGYDCAAFYQGAKAVSGDYFDIIPLGDGLWGFIVADVSGKGIPGSMVMAITRTIVRLVANKHRQHAAETLKETNRLIAKQIKRGMFVTAFYAILDQKANVVTYASAGHNPMVVYRAADRTHELATTKGIAIGFNEGPIFDRTVQEARISLQPGDVFVLYTDGFPEAMSEQSAEFGEERFYKAVAANGSLGARQLIQGLVGEISRHRGNAEQSDDLTIISVRRSE